MYTFRSGVRFAVGARCDPDPVTTEEMRERLLVFAIDVLRMTRGLPNDDATRHASRQLFRAASSVACNYRATSLSRSTAEFLAKMGVVREEADEVAFWFEFLERAALLSAAGPEGQRLRAESREVAAMISAAYRTSRQRYGKLKSP